MMAGAYGGIILNGPALSLAVPVRNKGSRQQQVKFRAHAPLAAGVDGHHWG